ncbi:MAG: hypothetical protein Q8S33_31835 [Myxococcales bacterium]|nr:hypothetical protein [Myxococcales bacterium]
MLWTVIRQTQWRPFLDLMSPSFFRVVPAGPLLAELRRLLALFRSAPAFDRAIDHRRLTLERAGLPIRIGTGAPPVMSASTDATLRGQRVLELYFHQVFSDGLTLLDLRRDRFSEEGGALVWTPSGALAEWSPAFRAAVQALYRGFYQSDDALFREGLGALGLSDAEAEIRSQFGEGQQRAVRFSLKDFQQKFHDVFVRCQETGSSIDIGFLPLGLYLATLYEHLEALGEPFDARAAFEAATQAGPSSARAAAG